MATIQYFLHIAFMLSILELPIKTYLIHHNVTNFERFSRVLKMEEKFNGNEIEKCNICFKPSVCLPLVQCPIHLSQKVQFCDLSDGEKGCCHDRVKTSVQYKDAKSSRFGTHIYFSSLFRKAKTQLNDFLLENDPAFTQHDNNVMERFPGRMDAGHKLHLALEELFTIQSLLSETKMNLDDIKNQNFNGNFISSALGRECPHMTKLCANLRNRYRSTNGLCNNPLNGQVFWGSSSEPIIRILPPTFEDGIWSPKKYSVLGTVLPNPRDLSGSLLEDFDRPHTHINLLLMQFGQFLTHDLIQTQSIKLQNGDEVKCCRTDDSGPKRADESHFACMPISISPQDPFYGRFGVRCINFVRLSLAPSSDCALGYGKPINLATHFLDGSVIYGSNERDSLELRSLKSGRLLMSDDMGREYLPLSNDNSACPHDQSNLNTCYKAGDTRANTIISLVALHTLFAREHNRVAHILEQLNPSWNDEILYQEARRIVIAELQHITYNEYLPLVLGEKIMKRYRLRTKQHGYSMQYDVNVNPSISSEFGGAAFRMGHSSVDGKFNLVRTNTLAHEIIHIPDVMLNATRFKDLIFFDRLLTMLLTQPMQMVDNSISYGLTRLLFRKNAHFGVDLAAFNIQRGRDLGLRSYNDYLQLMGHNRIHSFEEFPPEFAQKLASLYDSPDDIELWIGGLLEKPISGAIVGATFAEIIADQFSRTKEGDRYFYENSPEINPGAFKLEQLKEIRKTSLARLICDNANFQMLFKVQLRAFIHADLPWNPFVDCKSARIPKMHLGAWRNALS